jgi:hypothetical protein
LGFPETYNASSGVLTVTEGNNSARLTLDNFNGTFDFVSDGHGGTLITDACGRCAARGRRGHEYGSAYL